jgi:phosphatidyl-myo-inositol dimannoside synthase
VIEAVSELKHKYPEILYIVAGNGPDRNRIERMSKELELQGHVKFLGNVSDNYKKTLYQLCDIFVMPNRVGVQVDMKGFGIVYLEANSFKKPVIGGNSGGGSGCNRGRSNRILGRAGEYSYAG